MRYTILPQRGLIRLSGEEAVSFLQGLVSNDVSRLEREGMMYAALLSPQGKFLHDFFLIAWQGAILIDVEKGRLPDLLQRLKMYRLRSKVTIDETSESVVAIWDDGEPVLRDVPCFRDPRVAALGWRVAADVSIIETLCRAQEIESVPTEEYERHRLEIGVPDGCRDMIVDKSFLLHFGFEDLHGVDFKKGCYVGQEVTARSKHLGQVKKLLYKVRVIKGTLPPIGAPLYLGDTLIGEMRSGLDNIGLALMLADEAEKVCAVQADIHSGDTQLHLALPSWVKTLPSLP